LGKTEKMFEGRLILGRLERLAKFHGVRKIYEEGFIGNLYCVVN
jgi:hypothetical protein